MVFPWVWLNIELFIDIYYWVTSKYTVYDSQPQRKFNKDTDMFANDITLAGDNSSSTVYSLLSIADGKSIRGNAAATLGQPQTLTVSHSTAKRGSLTVDRHLVRLDKTKLNALSAPVTCGLYVVLEVPRDSTFLESEVLDMSTQLKNFLSQGNIDKLLNGEP